MVAASLCSGALADIDSTVAATPNLEGESIPVNHFEGMWGSAGMPDRVAGDDRYATAVEIARRAGGGSLDGLSDLIVVSGESFADALVASGLSAFLDHCPGALTDSCGQTAILLTRARSLPAVTAQAIGLSGVSAANITIIGGEAVISQGVRNTIARAGGWDGAGENPSRRLAGADRYKTAAAVADHVLELSVTTGLPQSFDTVVIATGDDFPDALSAGVLAYRFGHLLLLTPSSAADSSVMDVIGRLGTRCVIGVGGPAALPEKVLDDIIATTQPGGGSCPQRRFAGEDRYATAVEVAERVRQAIDPPGSEIGVVLASGVVFADALAATTLARREIVLLTGSRQVAAATRSWVMNRSSLIEHMTVVGGPVAISDRVAFEANNPQPSPVSTGSTSRPPLLRAPGEADHDRCRIPQVPQDRNGYLGRHSTAFPLVVENLRPDQHVRLAVIPVDWSDFPGDPADLPRKYEHVKTFMRYYEAASEGHLSFDAQWPETWYRLPDSIGDYPQPEMSDFNTKLAQDSIDIVDPQIDFSAIDIVVLIFPDFPPILTTNTDYAFGSTQNFNRYDGPEPRRTTSAEGVVRNYIGGGNFFDHRLRPVWSYYVHEAAHTFNLADWYMREANMGVPEYGEDLTYSIGPLNAWGVMSSQDGPSRTFVAWTRWLAGWLEDDQVACFEKSGILEHGAFDVELVALDVDAEGDKAVIIRTGPHRGVVVESRRPVFPDHDLVYYEIVGRSPQGLIVYEVDATKGNADGTLSLVPPQGQTMLPLQLTGRVGNEVVDALYNPGAVGVVDGLRIELVHSGERDLVRIGPA